MNRRTLLGMTGALGTAAALGVVDRVPAAAATTADQLPSRADVVSAMKLVNDYWINGHSDPGTNEWARSTYFSGNMAHYRLTRTKNYLDYTVAWAEKNSYGINGGTTTRNADSQCAGQTYLDLYQELGGDTKLTALKENLSLMVSSTKRDDWWWTDALHMAMPTFVRLGALINDNTYWVAAYQLYHNTKRLQLDYVSHATGLYSESTPLWYRDNTFAVNGPYQYSPSGKPVLWSRGNGWALAAHAKVLKVVPLSDKRGPEYAYTLRSMAGALAAVQRTDGFWNVNLADPAHFGGPETTGTAFFAFGIASGITSGVLERAMYLPVVARAWNGLVKTAVRSDGFLGYCQGVGGSPAQVDPNHTVDYGVGAFLMAGAEIAALTA